MKYYKMIYGNGTHGLRVFMFVLSSFWLALIIMKLSGDLILELPSNPLVKFNFLAIGLLATICLAGLSFFIRGVEGGMLRFFALTIGGLSQGLIAIRFTSTYPPLDVVSLFSGLLGLWFVGGAFYVAKDKQQGGTGVIGEL